MGTESAVLLITRGRRPGTGCGWCAALVSPPPTAVWQNRPLRKETGNKRPNKQKAYKFKVTLPLQKFQMSCNLGPKGQ